MQDKEIQDEEQRKIALLEEAMLLAQKSRAQEPSDLRDFLSLLFARGAAEDLLAYSALDLLQLAQAGLAHLGQRAANDASIRVFTPQNETGILSQISVIELINDNMPFLVDSVRAELDEMGLHMRLIVHPIVTLERDGAGTLTALTTAPAKPSKQAPAREASGTRESLIHIHIDRLNDEKQAEQIAANLKQTLIDVRLVVADWKPMLTRVDAVIQDLKNLPPPIPVAELAEAIQFLEWLRDNNFTFLGMREYDMRGKGAKAQLEPINDTGLGVLRDPEAGLLRRGRTDAANMPPEVRAFLKQLSPLIISKANLRSRVHRRVPLDYIGIKLFDANGELIGELRLAGLFTSTAYTRSVRVIPYLRRKVELLLGRAGFDPESHSGKALVNIVENFPRDELFQTDDDTLFDFALRVLQLDERPRIRVLHRFDKFGRFVSVLVYIPRERYVTSTRVKIADALAARFGGQVMSWNAAYPEGPLARLHFTIEKGSTALAKVEREELEADVTQIVRTFEDFLAQALTQTYDAATATAYKTRYCQAFSPAYQEHYNAQDALGDIQVIEQLCEQRKMAIDFHPAALADAGAIALKVYHRGGPIPLSDRVPVIEAMGFRAIAESSFDITPAGGDAVVVHDIQLVRTDGQAMDFAAADARLEAAFLAVWSKQAENDGYNALVIKADLEWRDVALIRAMSRYLRQALIPYSQDYMWATLTKHTQMAADIVALFKARFDPAQTDRDTHQATILARIETALSAVTSLDEDRILRRFVNLVQCMLRTNFYQTTQDGAYKPTIAFKLDSKKVKGLPDPRPMVEIFVDSPRVEGVHLRFGRIARGGLRWSDRPQDFRTEVLGLVKAQQVKNAVIVPVGAKGGFVPKWLPTAPREAVQAEGIAAYKLFVSSLLDMTDNIDSKGEMIVRDAIVHHDATDPYLVVAADKGTATFSDLANGISEDYHHWLGDAFASGGSVGYDHKKMGITARGAWEAVKRHFREIDIDIQTTPFTVVGVGDMSGDVFGNGMLLSPQIRLLAAFDHRDIFIDPEPDIAKSFLERTRMFALPRSSWQDYDKSLISAGGGVFPRSAKSIPLSPQIQAALGLNKADATPQEVMTAILKAQVDLLWFGGIGTYVRATSESDAEAGDRANDSIRITAPELRCRAIGEGANLGMTQKARIEAARHGVRLNTDAIDNSAGVNSSDVEVNIKIALGSVMQAKKISLKSRNSLLADMTPDVASLVLRNNTLQTLALSLTQLRGTEDVGFAQRLMQGLESEGRLDRKVEYLPDDREIEARLKRNEGLTRPELSVLLAYAKLALHDALLESSVPDDVYLGREVVRYFPKALQEKFPKALEQHRLRREIIATMLANSMINRGGATLLPRISDQTGASPAEIAAAFAAVRDAYGMTALNTRIDALDNQISGALQLQLYAQVQALLLDRIVWFLRNGALHTGLTQVVRRFGEGVNTVDAALERLLPETALAQLQRNRAQLTAQHVPEELARHISALPFLANAPDIVLVAQGAKVSVEAAGTVYFKIADLFALSDIAANAKLLTVAGYYDRLALDRAISSLAASNRKIAANVFKHGTLDAWLERYGAVVERSRLALRDIASGSDLSVAKLSVAAGLLADLADS